MAAKTTTGGLNPQNVKESSAPATGSDHSSKQDNIGKGKINTNKGSSTNKLFQKKKGKKQPQK